MNLGNILKQFTQREAHPFVQFLKYGIAGGIATAVDMAIFYFLSWQVFQALNNDDIVVRLLHLNVPAMDEVLRSRNFVINSGIAFIFSNLTAYLINFHWVFHPGRHSRHVEVALFYAVSLTAVFIGVGLGWGMIHYFHLSTTSSFIGKMFASLMINYVCRKYLIFKG
ncbi:MAG: GtrA family protein [Kiritimatiellia bacterium]